MKHRFFVQRELQVSLDLINMRLNLSFALLDLSKCLGLLQNCLIYRLSNSISQRSRVVCVIDILYFIDLLANKELLNSLHLLLLSLFDVALLLKQAGVIKQIGV